MYSLSKHSLKEKSTLHPWLQLILIKTLLRHDYRIDQGGRDWDEQQDYFNAGTSTLAPPKGKHLLKPDPSGEFEGLWSFAADVCPYINGKRLATDPANFGPNQKAKFAYFLALLQNEADQVLKGTGWGIRLGINWDRDAEILTDQKFDDWFHVELIYLGG